VVFAGVIVKFSPMISEFFANLFGAGN
jgi:hypothetical protein